MWLKHLVLWDIARCSNADRFVDRVYRLVGWLAFTRIGAAMLILFGLLGLVLWFRETRLPSLQLVTLNGSYVLGLLAFTFFPVLSLSIYEVGHALVLRLFVRRMR